MRCVFVTDELPRPGAAGHLALNHAIIAWLQAQGHDVIVLLTGARLDWPIERYTVAQVTGPAVTGWRHTVLTSAPLPALKILLRVAAKRLPGATLRRLRAQKYGAVDAVLGSFIPDSAAAWCARYFEKTRPDVVLADTIFRAAVLQSPALAASRRILIAHDLFFLRHRALTSAGYAVHPAVLSREQEALLLNAADAIAAIQPEEAATIREMCPSRKVFLLPMPAIQVPRPAAVTRLPDRLVFVGSASLPNLDGLRWFLDSVWPLLRRWRAGVTLDIAGDCCTRLARLPEGVNRLGRVKNLAHVLHQARLAIAPLRVGSGLKIKLLDYARHGLITIGTPASLAGFAADPTAPFLTAKGELGFAAAITRQLNEPPDDNRALAYVDRHYGETASFAGLKTALAAQQAVAELRRAE
jgi:hypothetical protein